MLHVFCHDGPIVHLSAESHAGLMEFLHKTTKGHDAIQPRHLQAVTLELPACVSSITSMPHVHGDSTMANDKPGTAAVELKLPTTKANSEQTTWQGKNT